MEKSVELQAIFVCVMQTHEIIQIYKSRSWTLQSSKKDLESKGKDFVEVRIFPYQFHLFFWSATDDRSSQVKQGLYGFCHYIRQIENSEYREVTVPK